MRIFWKPLTQSTSINAKKSKNAANANTSAKAMGKKKKKETASRVRSTDSENHRRPGYKKKKQPRTLLQQFYQN